MKMEMQIDQIFNAMHKNSTKPCRSLYCLLIKNGYPFNSSIHKKQSVKGDAGSIANICSFESLQARPQDGAFLIGLGIAALCCAFGKYFLTFFKSPVIVNTVNTLL